MMIGMNIQIGNADFKPPKDFNKQVSMLLDLMRQTSTVVIPPQLISKTVKLPELRSGDNQASEKDLSRGRTEKVASRKPTGVNKHRGRG
jgi:hypothetical protein